MSWIRHTFTSADAAQLTTLLNAEFDAAHTAIGAGSGGVGFEFFGNGRVVLDDNAPPPHATVAPSLAVMMDAGTVLRVAGMVQVLDDDVLLTGAPANFMGYCVPHVTFDEVSEQNVWSATWPTTRPAIGTGTLCYLETDADSVTLLDASENKADVINAFPLIQERLRLLEQTSGGGGEGGTSYWGALQKTNTNPTTIDQAIDTKIADYAASAPEGGTNSGTVPLPPVQRDEIAVNVLLHRYLLTKLDGEIDNTAPMYRGFSFSPGLGNWEEFVDEDATTAYLDTVNHTIG